MMSSAAPAQIACRKRRFIGTIFALRTNLPHREEFDFRLLFLLWLRIFRRRRRRWRNYLLWRALRNIRRKPWGPGIRLKQPCRSVWIICAQLLVLRIAEIAGPYRTRAINISRVVNPLIAKDVPGPVTDENQDFPRQFRHLIRDITPLAALGVVDRVPHVVAAELRKARRLPQMKPIPEEKLRETQKD